MLTEQLKRLTRESTQKEKEVSTLEEVYKVLIGQSKFSEELLTELIETREKELLDIIERNKETEARIEDLKETLAQQRSLSGDLSNWAERFDLQSNDEKKLC